jgi:hypothetical protein
MDGDEQAVTLRLQAKAGHEWANELLANMVQINALNFHVQESWWVKR